MADNAIHQIKPWRRFHLRLTAFYGIAVFGVLTPLAVGFYEYGSASELAHLQDKLIVLARSLADSVNGDAIAELRAPADKARNSYKEPHDHFALVGSAEADVSTIYVLLRTETPGQLRFAIDWTRDGNSAAVGEAYDATRFPQMIAGLDRPTVENEISADDWGLSLSGYAPVRDGAGRSVGVLGLDVKAKRIESVRAEILRQTVAIYGLAVLLLALAAIAVGRNVRAPLNRLIEAAGAIAAGDLKTRVAIQRSDEFGVAARHFDTMAAGLEEREFIRETFGRYVSKDVVAGLLADRTSVELGGEEREVTILFSDLRGYSTLSEALTPTQVVELLNEYLGEMNEIIDRHSGVIIEFLGDAILAVFGAPNALPGHPAAAVRCASEMREALVGLNALWREGERAGAWSRLGTDGLGQRIGVHTGRVVAGNLGSRTRMKYAVIGDAVNVAARLEQLNKEYGTEILMSAAVFERLPEELVALTVAKGETPVKGRQAQVPIYTINPSPSSAAEAST